MPSSLEKYSCKDWSLAASTVFIIYIREMVASYWIRFLNSEFEHLVPTLIVSQDLMFQNYPRELEGRTIAAQHSGM
jgi:hypothetical protein